MRQISIDHWTTPDALTVSEGTVPTCGPSQLLVRVKVVAVTHSLWLLIQGQYQRKPDLPFVPGTFVSGYVAACGDEVSEFQIGDRVMATLEKGGFADYAVAEPGASYKIPDGLSFETANVISTAYVSVYAALSWPRLLAISSGERLLVTGASGNTGAAAIEIGNLLGATVIGTASSEAKRDWVVERGAYAAITSDPVHLKAEVLAVTAGEGVDAVFDPVGGALFDQALRCLKPEGRIVPFGFASGTVPTVPANIVLVKNITVAGLSMTHYRVSERDRHVDLLRGIFAQLTQWAAAGRLSPSIAGTYPLDRVGDAFAAIHQPDTLGHVVISFPD